MKTKDAKVFIAAKMYITSELVHPVPHLDLKYSTVRALENRKPADIECLR
jgi:hypothetical protein